jgi:hypothetical protein
VLTNQSERQVAMRAQRGGNDKCTVGNRLARSAWEQDDQAGMISGLTSKRQEVIAVAADEDQSLRTSMAKDLFSGCSDRCVRP